MKYFCTFDARAVAVSVVFLISEVMQANFSTPAFRFIFCSGVVETLGKATGEGGS